MMPNLCGLFFPTRLNGLFMALFFEGKKFPKSDLEAGEGDFLIWLIAAPSPRDDLWLQICDNIRRCKNVCVLIINNVNIVLVSKRQSLLTTIRGCGKGLPNCNFPPNLTLSPY